MSQDLIKSNEYLQMMPIEQAKGWYDEFVLFSKSILKKDLDFGEIPGTNKPTLYKAGAEKLRFVYGLGVEMECIDKVLDLDRPFIKYTYRCTIVSKTGQKIAQCEGSCNSLEPKFGYIWKTKEELPESYDLTKLPVKTSGKKLSEFQFAISKAETTGNYGKPVEYWAKWSKAIEAGTAKKVMKKTKTGKEMVAYELDESATVYRILNPDVIGVDNTLMKMAQKRSFVGAMLLATGASEFFTQDMEDMADVELPGQTVYTDYVEVKENQVDPIKEELSKAIATMYASTDEKGIKSVWSANKKFQTVPDFIKAKDDMKAKYSWSLTSDLKNELEILLMDSTLDSLGKDAASLEIAGVKTEAEFNNIKIRLINLQTTPV